MTFSVSKRETQLSFGFASVPHHELVYCTNRTEEGGLLTVIMPQKTFKAEMQEAWT